MLTFAISPPVPPATETALKPELPIIIQSAKLPTALALNFAFVASPKSAAEPR